MVQLEETSTSLYTKFIFWAPKGKFAPVREARSEVGSWVQHLLDHVEGEVAVALQWAAASGVRVRFLGFACCLR